MLKSTIGRFRIISLLDGISFIYLLYCSIYLKRMMGDADAIRTPGMVHGVLFTIYVVALLHLILSKDWSFKRLILIGATCLIPFAPFWLDGWLKKQEELDSEHA